MKIKDLAKLKKEKTIDQIIALHTHNVIYLTDKQLTQLLNKRGPKL